MPSTDLPFGLTAIAEYLASGQSLRMNVSREADRAFRFDLKKADPIRCAKLDAELQRDFHRRLREKPRDGEKRNSEPSIPATPNEQPEIVCYCEIQKTVVPAH